MIIFEIIKTVDKRFLLVFGLIIFLVLYFSGNNKSLSESEYEAKASLIKKLKADVAFYAFSQPKHQFTSREPSAEESEEEDTSPGFVNDWTKGDNTKKSETTETTANTNQKKPKKNKNMTVTTNEEAKNENQVNSETNKEGSVSSSYFGGGYTKPSDSTADSNTVVSSSYAEPAGVHIPTIEEILGDDGEEDTENPFKYPIVSPGDTLITKEPCSSTASYGKTSCVDNKLAIKIPTTSKNGDLNIIIKSQDNKETVISYHYVKLALLDNYKSKNYFGEEESLINASVKLVKNLFSIKEVPKKHIISLIDSEYYTLVKNIDLGETEIIGKPVFSSDGLYIFAPVIKDDKYQLAIIDRIKGTPIAYNFGLIDLKIEETVDEIYLAVMNDNFIIVTDNKTDKATTFSLTMNDSEEIVSIDNLKRSALFCNTPACEASTIGKKVFYQDNISNTLYAAVETRRGSTMYAINLTDQKIIKQDMEFMPSTIKQSENTLLAIDKNFSTLVSIKLEADTLVLENSNYSIQKHLQSTLYGPPIVSIYAYTSTNQLAFSSSYFSYVTGEYYNMFVQF